MILSKKYYDVKRFKTQLPEDADTFGIEKSIFYFPVVPHFQILN